MQPTTYLRLEGLFVLGAALGVYFSLDGPLWLLLVLALAPDLSMLAYLAGPRVGALGYNSVHTYVLPLSLGGAGYLGGVPLAMQVAAIWVAHIGVDRLAGFGLKYETGFSDTHLDSQPAPVAVLGDK